MSGSMLEIESAAEVIACMSGSMLDMSLLLKLIKSGFMRTNHTQNSHWSEINSLCLIR